MASVFEIGQSVYSYHGPMMYEAKTLKKEQRNSEGKTVWVYFLHYQGWSKKWDEWVDEDRMIDAAGNKDKVKLINQKVVEDMKKKKGGKSGQGKNTDSADKKDEQSVKKRKLDLKNDLQDEMPQSSVKVSIPFQLKKQLVDDWENVTQEPHHVVDLPRCPTVALIFERFLESKRRRASSGTNTASLSVFEELTAGLCLYFDRALPTLLLYRAERPQFARVMAAHPGCPPSQIYGAEHLLRLFIRLPALLGQASMSDQESAQAQSKLSDFLKFLNKNSGEFFQLEYNVVPDDYFTAPIIKQDECAAADAAGDAAAADATADAVVGSNSAVGGDAAAVAASSGDGAGAALASSSSSASVTEEVVMGGEE